MTKERIKELEEECSRLLEKVTENRREIKRLCGQMHGVGLGDIVLCNGKRVLVKEITRTWSIGKPWIIGHFEKKDGSFSKASRYCYDWEAIRQ